MFLLQIAATAVIVNILSSMQVRAALDPIRMISRQAQGLPFELPKYSILIKMGSFWLAVVAGLAGIWDCGLTRARP